MGLQSGLENMMEGRYGAAAVDAIGVAIDAIGMLAPGGLFAGFGIRAYRASKKAPSLDDLSKAASSDYKNGFTKAGHSLQKHGSRPGSKWSQPDINVNSPQQANSRAQDLVDDVLTAPGSKVEPNPRGGWDAVAPDGRTVRFNRDGTMQGLRE